MSKLKYGPQEKPYTEDINDLIEGDLEKGGVGSGKRGHTTAKKLSESSSSPGHQIMDRKSNKLIPAGDFYDKTAKGLMNYSGFSDVGGSFMSVKQIANAISQVTGHSDSTSFDFAKDMVRDGRIKQIGKVFVVMKIGVDHKTEKKQEKKPEPHNGEYGFFKPQK